MRQTNAISIDITPEASESGQQRLKLTFGGKEETALYLDSPQARALASYLIQRAYRIDVQSNLKQSPASGS
jgi:hypothetical protein